MTPSSRRRFADFRRALKDGSLTADPAATTDTETGDNEEQPKQTAAQKRTYFWKYVRELKPFRWQVARVIGLALTAALLSLILPRATMHIIDVVLPNHQPGMLHLIGGLMLVVIAIQQSCDLLRNWFTAKLNARLLFRLRQRLYNHLLKLPLHELSNLKTGGITSRLSGDIDSVSGIVQIAIVTPFVAIVKVTLVVLILLWINWQLALAALLLLPVIVTLNLVYVRRIRPIYRSMRRDRGEIDGRVVETFGGIRVVRAFSREKTEARQYGVQHHTVIRKSLLAQLLQFIVWGGWGMLIPLAGLTIIWFGGALVLAGSGTVGEIVAFQLYIMMLLMPVSAIVRSYSEMQQALAATERIFDLLERPADKPDRPHARPAPQTVDRITFERAGFGYRPDEPVVHDINLDIPGGTTVALVGASGAGKTTLTHLVARFYDPDEGAIRLNGYDLRDFQLRSYRSLLAVVQQDVFLFDGTIAENIAYGKPTATQAEIEHAARRANADEFINRFAESYETIVGERGVRLSGGQAQRISIARALLADPQILILDEATSNLDTASEQLIQQSMQELLRDRTTFLIAHRLSTVLNADLIVVLQDGRIAEQGTHAELMAQRGAYAEMVERQRREHTFDDASTPAGLLE